jgi:hypothetical protein
MVFIALYVLGELHEVFPRNKFIGYPLFDGYDFVDSEGNKKHWDGLVSLDRWVYDLSEHGTKLMFVFLMYYAFEWELFRRFGMIEVMDVADYLLCYNYVWQNPWGINFEFGLVKIYMALGFTIYALWTKRHVGYSGSL